MNCKPIIFTRIDNITVKMPISYHEQEKNVEFIISGKDLKLDLVNAEFDIKSKDGSTVITTFSHEWSRLFRTGTSIELNGVDKNGNSVTYKLD